MYKGFWQDFTVAEAFGEGAIRDTYKRCKEWKDNVEYWTALVLTLNHKIWQWYKKDENMAQVYDELWKEADQWACNNFKGKDWKYYWRATD